MVHTKFIPAGFSRNSKLQRVITDSLKKSMSTSASDDVVLQSIGDKGIITLNRPKALNALNLSMIKKIYPALKAWELEKRMVLIKGAGEKAFCAGGDVRAVTESGLKGENLPKEFFRSEYSLNALIGTYHIPYVAFIDGITMGGGVGLSVHGHYRVATERTLFAMPETAIGLFPDVGATYFLPRLGGKLGLFLALTGHRLKGTDVYKAGIATHFCESSKLNDLEKELISCKNPESNAADILNKFSKESLPNKVEFSLASYMEKIDSCFSAQTVEEIFMNLETDGTEWAKKTLETLCKMSPSSLKISKLAIEEGACKDLQECLTMEYRLAVHACEGHDFYEGVKALLIDKGRKAEWKPQNLEEVSESFVQKQFAPLAPEEELKL